MSTDQPTVHILPSFCRLKHLSSLQGFIKLSIPPPPVGGENKIKGFRDGEENQKFEKKKKKILKI